MQRVQKIIAASGFCSRRKAEELIIEGKVTVNGVKITIGDSADPAKDTIMVGKQVIEEQEHKYIVLNKPSGYLTTRGDLWDRKDIMELVRGVEAKVYPVGRLDRDARGLLLLTSDGDFAQRVLHPSKRITKTYQASLDTPLSKEAAGQINEGVYVDSRRVRAKLRKIKPKLVEITIHEGRNKIVKKIFKAVGYYVKDLKRVGIGELRLNVAEGKWKELNEVEKELIFKGALSVRPRKTGQKFVAQEGSRRSKAKTKEAEKPRGPRVRKSYRARSVEEREHPKKRRDANSRHGTSGRRPRQN